jgi:hypothetical protein
MTSLYGGSYYRKEMFAGVINVGDQRGQSALAQGIWRLRLRLIVQMSCVRAWASWTDTTWRAHRRKILGKISGQAILATFGNNWLTERLVTPCFGEA